MRYPLSPFQFHCALSCSYQPQSKVEFVQRYYPLNRLNFSARAPIGRCLPAGVEAFWLGFTAFKKYQSKTPPIAPVLLTVALDVVDSFIRNFLGLIDQFVHGVVIQFNTRFASVILVIRINIRRLVFGFRDILG